MRAAQLVLSIVPPAAAPSFAASAARAMQRGRRAARVRRLQRRCARDGAAIARAIAPTGAPFVDVGIVGRGPGPGGERTRFYVSGAARAAVLELDVAELELVDLGAEIGTASAMKMAYSALNKGTDALLAAVLLAAERLGVRAPLMRELEQSQAEAHEAHARARAVLGRDGASGSRRRWPRSRRRTKASASRRSFIAAPSGCTRSSRRRRSPPRRARRSRKQRSLDETLAVLTAALERRVRA